MKREAVLPIPLVGRGHPVLRRAAAPVVDFEQAAKLARRMELTRRAKRGLALAAPQVGKGIRLLVLDDGRGGHLAAANPTIVAVNGGKVEGREGCLSWPGRWFLVPRWERVTVEAQDLEGRRFMVDADLPLAARMWQHELDHLDGRVIFGYPRAPDPLEQLAR